MPQFNIVQGNVRIGTAALERQPPGGTSQGRFDPLPAYKRIRERLLQAELISRRDSSDPLAELAIQTSPQQLEEDLALAADPTTSLSLQNDAGQSVPVRAVRVLQGRPPYLRVRW